MGVLYGQHILVEDARGTLIGNSQPLLEEQTGLTDWITVPLHSHGSDERIGTLFVSSAPGIRTTLRRGLRESLTDIAMWGSLLAAAIAIPLSILLGRPIIRSVSHLVVAAERFGSGDFSTRSPAPATRELRTLAAEEGTEVSLFFQQNDDEVCVLPVDRRRMTQVLTNLLNNAIQYCPPRSTIAVRAGARGDGGGARFRIWLPDQQRERSRAR